VIVDLVHFDILMDPAREPITPAQTTFLKLLDAYLHTSSEVNDSSSFSFLAPTLRDLLLYVQLSLRASLAATVKDDRSFVDRPTASSTEAPPATDARLPKVCEALVLVAQSSSTLLLREYDASTTRLRSQLLTGTGATLELLIGVIYHCRPHLLLTHLATQMFSDYWTPFSLALDYTRRRMRTLLALPTSNAISFACLGRSLTTIVRCKIEFAAAEASK